MSWCEEEKIERKKTKHPAMDSLAVRGKNSFPVRKMTNTMPSIDKKIPDPPGRIYCSIVAQGPEAELNSIYQVMLSILSPHLLS